MIHTTSISLETQGDTDIHDITNEIASALSTSGIQSGTVTIFCPSSTSSVTTIEFERGALHDLRRMLDEIIPPDREYAHNARWDDGNGQSHVRAALLGPSLTVPFVNGNLILGTWQHIIYIDFDVRPRQRKIVLQLIGE